MAEDLSDLIALTAAIRSRTDSGPDGRTDDALGTQLLAIKDARMDARDADRQAQEGSGEDLAMAGQAAWTRIFDAGTDYLGQSADLEVAAWVCEAALRLYGFAGLAQGMALLDALVETLWERGLYPALEDDGQIEDRVAPLVGLNGADRPGALVQAMKIQPLTTQGDLPLAYWHYEAALALGRLTDEDVRRRRIDSGTVPLEAFAASMVREAPTRLKALHAALTTGARHYSALSTRLQSLCGADAPPSSFIAKQFEGLISCLETQATHVSFEDEPEEVAAPVAAEAAVNSDAPAARHTAMTRERALQQVLDLADWFDSNEPNGMAAPALREAVRRARLPLKALLAELIPSEDSRREFLMRAGLSTGADSEQ